MSDKLNTNCSPFVPEYVHNKNAKPQATTAKTSKKSKPVINNGKGSKGNGSSRSRERASAKEDVEWNLEDEIASGNFKLNGKRTKISINHLLDFQLPEIERPRQDTVSSSGRRRRSRNQTDSHERVYLHGDSFVNANYKFLVDDSRSYETQSNDPNIPLDAECIRRVVIPKGQLCPICLTDNLIAPRMASCGHVFCQTCLLQLFKNDPSKGKNDEGTLARMKRKEFRECPLCSTMIKRTNVKPVLFTETPSKKSLPVVGQEVELQLMCRPHGSLLPLPVGLNIDPLKVGNFPSVERKELSLHSRIMKCNNAYAIKLLEQDNVQIYEQLEVDKALYNDNGSFAKMAIDENLEQIERLRSADHEKGPDLSSLTVSFDGSDKYTDKNAFFYYQTGFNSPTTRFFISPLDVKILKNAFPRYQDFPSTLKVKVEDINYGSMVTETTISKFKYFSHLPIGVELAFIALDWRNENIIPKEVYDMFSNELKHRHKKAMIRRNKENKDKLIYQAQLEQKHMEFYQRENNDLLPSIQKTVTHFPSKRAPANADLTKKTSKDSSQKSPKPHLKERTVWGTQITVTDQTVIEEDREFEKMLLEASKSKQKSFKKKGKTLLLSNSSTRTL